MFKKSNKFLNLRLFMTLSWMLVAGLSSGCVYTIAGNVDAGAGRVGDDAYALQRTGVSLGGHFPKVPLSLDLKLNRESGQSSGHGELNKKFFQDHFGMGVGFWLPSDNSWEPYVHLGFDANEFQGLKTVETKPNPLSNQKEVALGLRRAFSRENGNNDCFYGYTIEGFASRGDVIAEETSSNQTIFDKKMTTVGLRFTGFFDFGKAGLIGIKPCS